MTLCVYALTTRSRGALRLRGLDGEPLRTVTVGRVSAVVGEVRRLPRATHEHLARYDAVMRRLFERYAAMLPARFATGIDRGELAVILRDRQDSLAQALRHVRGRAQMTVRIHHSSVAVARALPGSRSPGIDYLRRRAAEAAVPAFDPVRLAVKRWIRDERVERRERVVTIYHLIPRGAAEAYRDAIIEGTEEAGLRTIVSGPFPAYAFAGW